MERKWFSCCSRALRFRLLAITRKMAIRVNCCPTTIPEFIDVSEVPPKFPCLVLTKDEPHCPVWCEEFVRRTHGQTKEVTYYDGSTLRINLSDDSATEWMKTFDFQGKRITHWMPVRLPCIELDKGDAE